MSLTRDLFTIKYIRFLCRNTHATEYIHGDLSFRVIFYKKFNAHLYTDVCLFSFPTLRSLGFSIKWFPWRPLGRGGGVIEVRGKTVIGLRRRRRVVSM